MARLRRVIHKTKRLRRTKYHRVRTLSDDLPIQDTHFASSSGLNYGGTPEFQGETLRPSQHACQVKAVNQPPIEVEKAHRKPVVTDYVSLAIKAAKALNKKTSLAHIDNVAEGLFKFDIDTHQHIIMPDIVSQEIVNWIITLSKQPILPDVKLRLAKKFIVSLAPVNSSVEEQENLPLVWPR